MWQVNKNLVMKLSLKNHKHILSLLMQRRKDSLSVTAGEAFKYLQMFHKPGSLSSKQRGVFCSAH